MTILSEQLIDRLGVLTREGRQMAAVAELAKDRLCNLRQFISRRGSGDAAVADWDLVLTAFDLLIDMSEAVEATGDLCNDEYEAVAEGRGTSAAARPTCAA